MSHDLTSTGSENYRTYRATGFTVSARPLRDGVQITWENTLSSEYPIIRGFRKTGGLNDIEKSDYLISDSSENRGEINDRLNRDVTYFYFFRSYLNYIPGSAEDPSIGEMFSDAAIKARERRRLDTLSSSGSWFGRNNKQPAPAPPPEEKDDSQNPLGMMFAGLLASAIVGQRGDESAHPIVKAINQFAFNDGVNRLEATASPYYLTFQYSIPNDIDKNEEDGVLKKIDGVINKEKLKWERIEYLEKEYMLKNKEIMNSYLPDTEKLNKLKLLQESYADLMDKVRNM